MGNLFLQTDLRLFFFINSLSYPWLTDFFRYLSGAGNFGLMWVVLAVVLVVKTRRYPRVVLATAVAIILSLILSLYILKPWVGRVRPFYTYPGIIQNDTQVTGYSFPSGHSSVSFAAAFVLAWAYPQFAFYLWGLAGVVGLSRVYLGVHYPSDVVAGAILGIGVGLVVVRALRIGNKGRSRHW